jgi:hypothetical protein
MSVFLSSHALLPSFFLTPRVPTPIDAASLYVLASRDASRLQKFGVAPHSGSTPPPVGPPLHLAVLLGSSIVALSGNVATAGTTTARRPAPYGGQRPGDDLVAIAAALHEVPRSAQSLSRFVRSDPTTTVPHRRCRATAMAMSSSMTGARKKAP